MHFHRPPVSENEQGDARTYGFELEFAGVSLQECVRLVEHHFGGNAYFCRSTKAQIETKLGTFTIEVDARIIQITVSKIDKIFPKISRKISELSQVFVPLEIVTPPLHFSSFAILEGLKEELRNSFAKETKKSGAMPLGFTSTRKPPLMPLIRSLMSCAHFYFSIHGLRK